MKDDQDHRANQLNPNNSAYWSSRESSSDPRGRDFDDGDDDPNHPYNLNPGNPGISFSGFAKPPTPEEFRAINEKHENFRRFQSSFLKVAAEVLKPELDKFANRLRALDIAAETHFYKGDPGGSGFLEVELRFGDKRFVPYILFSFAAHHRQQAVIVKSGLMYGIDNITTQAMNLEGLTSECVFQIVDSFVRKHVAGFSLR